MPPEIVAAAALTRCSRTRALGTPCACDTVRKMAKLPEVLDFMQVLWRVVHGLERRSKRMAVRTGVTGPQRLVIRLVGLDPRISASELAALLHVHRSTMTGVLRRLEHQGMLSRRPYAHDRRRSELTLSARGQKMNRTRSDTAEARIGDALQCLSTRDRLCTRRALAAIAERLERGIS
jgi:MarR family transcriptional regulator, organic hydroperoxide resistance regulator